MNGMNYINGEFVSLRNDFSSINPSNEEAIGFFPQSNDDEINNAIISARKAFLSWRDFSKVQRAEYFWKLSKIIESKIDYISNAISLETGKSLNESRAEVVESLHMIQYCFGKGRESSGDIIPSEIPERDGYIIRKPKVAIAVIAPWNFPFAVGGCWNAGPAILEGNTVILKPSELSPIVGQITAELYHEAGFPPGVFNLLHGDGEVGEKISNNELIDHVAFTGSAEVGKLIRIACANSFHKTCNCEMGGKSAVIVFEDCDLDLAVSACINSAFKLSGQRCVSSGRLLIQRSILDKFKDKFIEKMNYAFVGDPNEIVPPNASVCFGPVISKDQKEKIEYYNKIVRDDPSAKIILDSALNFKDKGYFIGPFIYECEWSDKPYLKQEVFGPHVAIVPFDSVEDAIRIYNDTIFGLSLGAITNDFRIMRKIRKYCDSGMMYFNLGSIGAESHFFFGGVKASGNGWPSAAGMFDTVVHKVSVSVNHADSLNFPQGLK
jgi:aldehyde dehydrogenase (NAD+)